MRVLGYMGVSLLRSALVPIVAAGLSTSACDRRATSTASTPPTSEVRPVAMSADARTLATHRLYRLGEAYFERGQPVQAVALWRQVFLLLPTGPEGDPLRLKLVARMGHALLVSHTTEGNDAQLDWGRQMLERFVAKHEALIGDDDNARGERAPLYELIGEMELRLADEEDLAPESSESMPAEIDREFAALGRAQAEDSHAGEVVGPDGIRRQVVVPKKKKRLATLDEPRVRAFLRDSSPLGPSLLAGGDEPYNPTRPLVRAGISRVRTEAGAEDGRLARQRVRELVRTARPSLEQCYAEALGRAPIMVSKVEFGLTIATDGSIEDATLTAGDVVDAAGNACVIWAVMEARPRPSSEQLASAVRIDLPVTFFVQGEGVLRPDFIAAPGGFLDGGSANPGDALRQYGAARATKSDQSAAEREPQR